MNFQDSSLLVKEFKIKMPDGTGTNILLSSIVVKLNYDDFIQVDKLIERSHFWSLETVTYPYIHIDGVSYIYEYKEPIKPAVAWIKKGYHITSGIGGRNSDFDNLGQFFVYKAGYKNYYKNRLLS